MVLVLKINNCTAVQYDTVNAWMHTYYYLNNITLAISVFNLKSLDM